MQLEDVVSGDVSAANNENGRDRQSRSAFAIPGLAPLSPLALLVITVGCAQDDGADQRLGRVLVFERNVSGTALTISTGEFGQRSITSSRDNDLCHIEMSELGALESAGALTISGGTSETIVLSPSSRNDYGATFQGYRYVVDDVISFSGAGETVPGFTGDLPFPSTLTLTSPLPTALSKAGLSVAWNPTKSPVEIAVRQFLGAVQIEMRCSFVGSSGMASISSEALTDFVVGTPVFVSISTETHTMGSAGQYALFFQALFQPFAGSLPLEP
jgi:hypothetical protein